MPSSSVSRSTRMFVKHEQWWSSIVANEGTPLDLERETIKEVKEGKLSLKSNDPFGFKWTNT